MELSKCSISNLREKLDSKEISAIELTQYYLNRIKKIDPKINSYITVCEEEALEMAKRAQKKIDEKKASILTGIPLSIKDNICTKGIITTCASRMLENFNPPYNATVVTKLMSEDAVILGKVNMDEFAMGSSTQSSFFKKTKNPYDLNRVPGGSSGGSAASVSAGLAAASLGSDTGGSIRQPAAFCGLTGIKPTYGTVSRHGLIAFASSFDQIGPLAKSARDCALILEVIAGKDNYDSTSKEVHIDFASKIGQSIKGLKIGIPAEYFDEGLEGEVKRAVIETLSNIKSMGAEVIDVSMPSLKYAVAAYYLISSAEAVANLARYDGIRFGYCVQEAEGYEERIKKTRKEGFGEEVKRRILLGNYALSSGYYDQYYKKALTVMQRIKREYEEIFKKCDAIITPTMPSVANKIGENENDPIKIYLSDIYTVPVNIAGLPALNTTCGYDKNGMPIGLSIVGKKFDDATVLQVADAIEKNFKVQYPAISG